MYPSVMNIIRGNIAESSSDDGNYAIQKINYRGATARAEMVFPYGMHANIPADTLAIMMTVACDPENRVAIPMSGRKRVKGLSENEVIFFHPESHSYLWFRSNGDIDIHSENDINIDANIINISATAINITANTNLTGDFDLTGDYNSTGTMTNNGKDVGSTHAHNYTWTDPAGSGTTDGPN